MANFPDVSGSTNLAALNTPLQSVKLKREAERNTFWIPMATDLSVWKRGYEVKPGIVLRKTELLKEGYDSIRMPVLKRLSDEPTYGDNQLEGNEEDQNLQYVEVKVNRVKHAVKSSGAEARRRLKKVNPFSEARPQLSQYFSKALDIDGWRGFTRGYSNNLLAAKANGGILVNSGTQVSHPNMFVNGLAAGSAFSDTTDTGLVLWNATPATYETNVSGAIDAQGTDSSAFMSLQVLDRLVPQITNLEIEPLDINGQDFYVCSLHQAQWMQMAENAGSLRNLLEKVDQGMGEKSAIFSGATYMYSGGGYRFIFQEAKNSPGVSSSGTVTTYEFASNMTRGTQTQRIGGIMGQGALMYATAEPLGFVDRDIDYKSYKGVQAATSYGYARTDLIKDDGTTWSARDGKNRSSMAFITYSPRGAITSASAV